jgi:hypothetical protein
MTFEEVMAYDKRNYEVYCDVVKRYKDKGIIPFVGAGMSATAGFATWNNYLKQECLNNDLEYDDSSDPLDKASEICKTIGAAQFRRDIVKNFGGEFSEVDWSNVIKHVQDQAIGLFPKLFHDVIVTTNYDRLLEHLYRSPIVSHPGHDGQLNRALQIGASMVFKLHGCVSEPEEIILTRESYAQVYETGKNKEAVNALEKILTSQTVLFLGCSLKNDYTVKHWSKMIAQPKGKGIEHFAVIGCNRDERQSKRRDLGDMNIFPILYDDTNHDIVKIILNQLYIDTNGGKPANNLPPQNKYFSGRTDQLENINRLFKERSHSAVNICQTVSGLGGIGKTQLAIEYAYRYFTDFKNCIWFINAETSTTTQNYFDEFAERFNIKLPPDYRPEDLQQAAKNWLSENKDWLLIFDNLEFADTITPYLPDNIIGRIIITTRNTRIDLGTQIALGVFDMDEALVFLKKRLSNDEELHLEFYNSNANDFDTEACKLIIRLGFLPLALEQAAAYIKEVKCTITYYLELLSESGLLAFEEKHAKPEHYEKANDFEQIVTATWNISFNHIVYEGSRQLLNLCAYMAPDKIPVAFFVEMREMLPSPIKEDMTQKLTRGRIVTELRTYSLTSGDLDYINVHRLVQEVVRKSHDEVGNKE